jgi:hypothetical protein
MAGSATESPALLSLMLGGGIVAMLGFWLMLRVGTGGESLRIGIGSAKISASSAGFAVFFGGMAAFSAPIIAPGSIGGLLSEIAPVSLMPGEGSTGFVQAGGRLGPDDEPDNDQIAGASPVAPLQLVSGRNSDKDVDWYRFDTRGRESGRIEVNVSVGSSGCHVRFFDNRQHYVGTRPLDRGKNLFKVSVTGNPGLYVQIGCVQGASADRYTIAFRPLPD